MGMSPSWYRAGANSIIEMKIYLTLEEELPENGVGATLLPEKFCKA